MSDSEAFVLVGPEDLGQASAPRDDPFLAVSGPATLHAGQRAAAPAGARSGGPHSAASTSMRPPASPSRHAAALRIAEESGVVLKSLDLQLTSRLSRLATPQRNAMLETAMSGSMTPSGPSPTTSPVRLLFGGGGDDSGDAPAQSALAPRYSGSGAPAAAADGTSLEGPPVLLLHPGRSSDSNPFDALMDLELTPEQQVREGGPLSGRRSKPLGSSCHAGAPCRTATCAPCRQTRSPRRVPTRPHRQACSPLAP
jgi:hypothetical protein